MWPIREVSLKRQISETCGVMLPVASYRQLKRKVLPDLQHHTPYNVQVMEAVTQM